jgi:putative tryptophan/tyrosine transport system substrate-binding protein
MGKARSWSYGLPRTVNHLDLLQTMPGEGSTSPLDANLMLRILFLTLIAICVTLSIPHAEAQPSIHHPRIGFLGRGVPPAKSAPLNENLKAFHEGLRELGYVEGGNVFIEYRYDHPGRSQELVDDLVHLEVNVIVATSTPDIIAAKQATSKIPIVMVSALDPVAKFVETLAKPGGNITGVTNIAANLNGKLLQLITEAVPEPVHVGVLRQPGTWVESLIETEIAARALKRQLQIAEVRNRNGFEKAMITLSEKRVRALVILPAVLFARNSRRIAEIAVKNRLAAIFWQLQFANAGGLMAYGPRRSDLWRRAGVLVGKILNGAKPADLPVEQPTKFDLLINLKTAKALGIKIPAHLLMEADKVIE